MVVDAPPPAARSRSAAARPARRPTRGNRGGIWSRRDAGLVRSAGTGTSSDADTIAVGIFDGEGARRGRPAEVAELLASGEARRRFKSLALTHADGRRWLLVGPRRARSLHARAGPRRGRARPCARRASSSHADALLGAAARTSGRDVAAALVEGTSCRLPLRAPQVRRPPARGGGAERRAARAPDRRRRADGHRAGGRAQAALVAAAVNRARDLQNRPGNDLTPTALGRVRERARRRDRRPVGRGRGPRGIWRAGAWAPSPPSRRAPSRSPR